MLSPSSCHSCVWLQASPLIFTNVSAGPEELALSLSRAPHTPHLSLWSASIPNTYMCCATCGCMLGEIYMYAILEISTRMQSSRMRTTRSSSRRGRGGGWPVPQLLPWVWAWTISPSMSPLLWAWTRSSSTSPLGVGLDQIPLNFPLGCGPGDPPQTRHPPPCPCGQTAHLKR